LSKKSQINVSENVQEYLEVLWIAEEDGNHIAKVGWLAKHLDVTPPSVVEMYKKLEEQGFVKYYPYRGVKLQATGRELAKNVVRNHRLFELLMKKTLNIDVDERIACSVEHQLTEEFANALCTLLKHPRKCPHGKLIPKGTCCSEHVST
jgi:DtxR family Mn-dependent transcriptional regulator